MNNQFTPRVSDIIMYSKEEANRLNNSYIGAEHLLLGLIREGEGKAIEILFNLQIDLKQLKHEVENSLHTAPDLDIPMKGEDVTFNEEASRILKLCILEARLMKCEMVDTEHILLAIMRQKNNNASQLLETHEVTYDKVVEMLAPKTDPTPRAGLGFDEDEDEEEDRNLIHRPQNPQGQGR